MESTEHRPLKELYARRALCLFCIQTVSKVSLEDPRRPDAIVFYNEQLSKIDKEIESITGKIPDITIGLKPAILFPKAEGVEKWVTMF